MVDGEAGIQLIDKSLSKKKKKKHVVPLWCVESKRTKRLKVPKPSTSKIKSILGGIKSQLEVTPKVMQELSQTIFKEMGKNPDYVSTFQAPVSILNQRVSASRRFAA